MLGVLRVIPSQLTSCAYFDDEENDYMFVLMENVILRHRWISGVFFYTNFRSDHCFDMDYYVQGVQVNIRLYHVHRHILMRRNIGARDLVILRPLMRNHVMKVSNNDPRTYLFRAKCSKERVISKERGLHVQHYSIYNREFRQGTHRDLGFSVNNPTTVTLKRRLTAMTYIRRDSHRQGQVDLGVRTRRLGQIHGAFVRSMSSVHFERDCHSVYVSFIDRLLVNYFRRVSFFLQVIHQRLR